MKTSEILALAAAGAGIYLLVESQRRKKEEQDSWLRRVGVIGNGGGLQLPFPGDWNSLLGGIFGGGLDPNTALVRNTPKVGSSSSGATSGAGVDLLSIGKGIWDFAQGLFKPSASTYDGRPYVDPLNQLEASALKAYSGFFGQPYSLTDSFSQSVAPAVDSNPLFFGLPDFYLPGYLDEEQFA